jgi:Ca2+:H+ antiporter
MHSADVTQRQGVRWIQYWALVLVPIALIVERLTFVGAPGKFLIAAIAILPVARLISRSTEQLSHYTGDAVGGLLNATFGNLPELIIGLTALNAGLYSMVAASLIGAILFNLLLVLGVSFLLGGIRHHNLDFNVQAMRVYSTMMFIAVISLALPSIYERTFAPAGPTLEQEKINIGLAGLLLVLYALYLLFMIVTHPEDFASSEQDLSSGHDDAEEHELQWSKTVCIAVLVGSSVLAAVLSEVLVGAVEGTGEALGLSTAFLGIVLLASVGGAAEGMSAVTMARKGRLDLSLGISLGSCILVALFVAPVLVFASYFVGPQPFLLSFEGGGIVLLFLALVIGALVTVGGSGNWYKGAQLITVYLMIALLLYFVPV